MLTKAIEVDPKFARAYAFLGYTYLFDARFGWVKNPTQSIKQAEEFAKSALAIDENVYLAHLLLGSVYGGRRLYEQAITAKEKAIECEPNNASGINDLAHRLIYAGRPEEGLILVRKANRLNPHPPLYFLPTAVYANYLTGWYEEALHLAKSSSKGNNMVLRP